MGPSTLSSWARLIAGTLTARGIDPQQIFHRAGLRIEQLEDPNSRYPFLAMQRLWTLASEATRDDCFGLDVGRSWHPTTFHALGYCSLASTTLYEALTFVERYCRVVSTGAGVELVDHGTEVEVVLVSRNDVAPLVAPAAMQAGLMALVVLCRVARGDPIVPRRVTLSQDEPAEGARFSQVFGCAIEFNAPRNALVFDANELAKPLPAGNPVLVGINEHALDRYVTHIDLDSLGGNIRSCITRLLLSGHVDQSKVAAALNLSRRTMQRKLKDEGVTFSELLDETRRRLAQQYSKDSTLSSAELAYLIGFSDSSSLFRAMKRWKMRFAAAK